jgi:hypothetical protein
LEFINGDNEANMADNKFIQEFKRLLKKHGLIVALLNVLDADIIIRRELERVNNISFTMRPSVDVEKTREKWQRELAATKDEIDGMLTIIQKQAARELE